MKILVDIFSIIVGVLLVVFILLQQRGHGWGVIFGSGGDTSFFQKRGLERRIYQLTWLFAVVFILISLLRLLI
jgi:protein translocase SecG subunit